MSTTFLADIRFLGNYVNAQNFSRTKRILFIVSGGLSLPPLWMKWIWLRPSAKMEMKHAGSLTLFFLLLLTLCSLRLCGVENEGKVILFCGEYDTGLLYRWWNSKGQLIRFLIAFSASLINKWKEKYRGSFTIIHKISFTSSSGLPSSTWWLIVQRMNKSK